jgi:ATP-dependent helicase HrpA
MSSMNSDPSSTSASLLDLDPANLLRRHYFRLKHQRSKILSLPNGQRKTADIERWNHALQQSQTLFDDRQKKAVTLSYDPELPITNYRQQIIDLLQNRQVLVLCGETGSGKSTQLPKLCIEAGFGKHGWIGHTQPRRIAARSVAARLAEELDSNLGDAVGYKVRFNDQTKPESLIKLMTDGVLLAEIQRDRFLDAYDLVIVDEAHERSLNIDLLMAYLHNILPKRPDLRIVITSATIDADRFSEHFVDAIGPAPIVQVEGRSYPVEIRYRGALGYQETNRNTEEDYDASVMDRFCDAVDELFSEGRGDILAFFPSERDIRDAAKQLRGHLTRIGRLNDVEVLPLYARLTEAEQQRVFKPHSKTRIVLSTNVAESSLTVPGIRYVIDSGTARISRFAAKSKVQRLPIEPIPQASANQRSGRCGRLGPGIAIRLYDEQDFLSRPQFATPEIRRSDLASTIIHTKSLGISDFESLPWLDPPRTEAVREGMNVLLEIGAIDQQEILTEIGRKIARWPVDPRVGRMIIESETNGCLNEMLIVAAALESQDPRMRPPEKAAAADEAHSKFRDPTSDFVSYLRIWDFYHKLREDLSRSRLQKALQDNFLSVIRMREWADVHRQLLESCKESNARFEPRRLKLLPIDAPDDTSHDDPRIRNTKPGSRNFERNKRGAEQVGNAAQVKPTRVEGYDRLHLSILSGLLSGIAMMDEPGKYRAAQNLEVTLWPGSGVRQSKPKWIVAAERVETTQRYVRTVAYIEPEWIEQLAGHLIKYSYEEPHFSRKQGRAMVMRRGSLFGLPVSPKVSVPLPPLNPSLARTLLIEHGLAQEELSSRARFWEHNCKLIEEVRALANKTRRRDLIVDTQILVDFYEQCIPSNVVDRVSLEKWDRELEHFKKISKVDPSTKSPFLTWDDIVLPIDRAEVNELFPEQVSLGVTQLPLTYKFEPGHESDGVSVSVPAAVVHQIHSERLEWLVPGLIEEKLTYLIKSLPKRLRRQLVPVLDTVTDLLPALTELHRQQSPFWKSICEVISKHIREPVKPNDFDVNSLPEHLRMRIELIDQEGKTIKSSRDLLELQQSQKEKQTAAFTTPGNKTAEISYDWKRSNLTTWDIESLPKSVVENRGGVRIELYPCLVTTEETIATTVVDHKELAEQMLRVGNVRLFQRMDRKEIRSHIQHFPQLGQISLWLSDRFPSERLRDLLADLVARLAFLDQNWNAEALTPAMTTKLDFDLARMKRLERIGLAASEVSRWLPKVAEANYRLRALLEKTPSSYVGNLKQIREQANEIWRESFVWGVPWCWVKEYPRYLQSLAVRVERLKTVGTQKDLATENVARVFWDDYVKRLQQLQPSQATLQAIPSVGKQRVGCDRLEPFGSLLDYRWHIEELRVSIHSQHLGTKISISPKRLEKLRDSMEELR